MSRNRGVDGPGMPPQFSSDEREINLLNRAVGELTGKIEMRSIVLRDDQATTCSFVETMNDSGPLLSADAGEIFAMTKERVYESSAVSAGAGVHRHSSWLIDHNQIVILEEDRQGDRFSLEVE